MAKYEIRVSAPVTEIIKHRRRIHGTYIAADVESEEEAIKEAEYYFKKHCLSAYADCGNVEVNRIERLK